MAEPTYIGRFAPSPSGPLHLGSLVCALASYLDAKANHGKWLVRIEDIDPPREQAGADKLILNSLKAHGLYWDDEVGYQSKFHQRYFARLNELKQKKLSYHCNCTRKRLKTLSNLYDGHCRLRLLTHKTPSAIRLNTDDASRVTQTENGVSFNDLIQGDIYENIQKSGDFIVHRKDGLFAYQLAVSSDDTAQKITRVVRGSDLLETTNKQILLMALFGTAPPSYAHIPVLVDEYGNKLSKQNHAPAIKNDAVVSNLNLAMKALGLPLAMSEQTHDVDELLKLAVNKWALAGFKQFSLFKTKSSDKSCVRQIPINSL